MQMMLVWRCVVGIRRRNHAKTPLGSQREESIVVGRVEGIAVIEELNNHSIAAKELTQSVKLAAGIHD
jgi:hypothetical protein